MTCALFSALTPSLPQRMGIYRSRILAALRDLLLPKLMSGEIRLKDAEQALEAVA
jgi:type I restriction enzyme, S subunit